LGQSTLAETASFLARNAEGRLEQSVGFSLATHGSGRALARHTGTSKPTLHRWFQSFNMQPHRHRRFKISNDPHVVDKVQDIVAL